MKIIILTILIFLTLLSSGQNNSTTKIVPLRIIASKSLPDTEMQYNTNGIVLRFSKSLFLEYSDSLAIRNYLTTPDTSVYSIQDIESLALILRSIREYFIDSGIINLTVPTEIYKGAEVKSDFSAAIIGSAIGFYDDMICQMLDSGEFNIFSNGIKLNSVTKAHVVEKTSSSRSETIRYYSENNKELKTCCPCEYIMTNSTNEK
jgi:hypothetical protein